MMRRLYLEFAPRRTTPVALKLALAVMLLAAAGYTYHLYAGKVAVLARLESVAMQQIQGRNAERARRSAVPDAATLSMNDGARRAAQRLAFPWDKFFMAIEAPDMENVALLELLPEPAKGYVLLTAEARDFPAMLRYVQQLQEQEGFADVHVTGHHVQVQEPTRPVRFVVHVRWTK